MDKQDLFRHHIAGYLVEIEEECRRLGVPMSCLTLIARDPTNDEMSVVLTNDPDLDKACALAANLTARKSQ